MTRREIVSKLAFYIVLAILFTVCAATVILFALGYKIDIKNREISQTGIIIVETDDNLDEIFIDGESRGAGKLVLRNLDPGYYDVEIKREKYQTYRYDFYLNPGEAKIIDNVVLFLEKPIIKEFGDTEEVAFKRLADTSDIQIADNELFLNTNFLTRFENKISDACWYPNERFIGVTVENKFRIIDVENRNSFELFEKNSDKPVIFINSGKSALFESDNTLFTAKIR